MSKTKPKRQTRYQTIKTLIDEGQCGLLPVDAAMPCSCPKQGGPEQPHPDYPGKVWHLTCQGCKYFHDLFLDNHVCTHPQAHQVAAQWLTEVMARWERRQPEWFAGALAKLGTVTDPNELAEIYRRARALQMPDSAPLMERSESKDAFDYVPADIQAKIPRLSKTEKLPHEETIVWLKFFTPDSSWSWYVMEFDGEDILFARP